MGWRKCRGWAFAWHTGDRNPILWTSPGVSPEHQGVRFKLPQSPKGQKDGGEVVRPNLPFLWRNPPFVGALRGLEMPQGQIRK